MEIINRPNPGIVLVSNIVREVQARGGTLSDILDLIKPENQELVVGIADLIVQKTRSTYRVCVDYRKSLAEMIDDGKYDWKNGSINEENFPIPAELRKLGVVNRNIELVPCVKRMTRQQIESKIRAKGKRPGNLPELLALGAAFPRLQLEFPIVQISSVWSTRRKLRGVYLRRGNKERGLSFIWLHMGFLGYYRIIAVEP